ncbi:MAG: hypothetical protein M3447_12945 [Acidobacteriota bacterium]|nr:hypothetical protein [Acidobacteriota bacterium]
MSKRIFVSLILSVSCVLLLAACGESETTTTNSSNATAANKTATTLATPVTTTNTPAATTTTPATSTTAGSGDKIGVPECDDYLAKYEACVSAKVPAAARAQYETGLEQNRKAWRQLAATAEGKASLAQMCKMANDSAKQSLKSFGCDF